MRVLLVLGFFALVHLRSLGAVDGIARLLGGKVFHWLGELSYGAYLIHLLILYPVAAGVIARFGTGLGAAGRFALTGAIVVPATYVLAFLAYRLVELPGQRLGKAVIARVTGSRTRAPDPARGDRGTLAAGRHAGPRSEAGLGKAPKGADRRSIDAMVGATGFEPATPTPPV